MRSDPYFHPVLFKYQDLEQIEKDLGIRDRTPILVDPAIHDDPDSWRLDPYLRAFFASPTWTTQPLGTRKTYGPIYRPLIQWLDTRRHKTIWEIDEDDLAVWKSIRTDFSVNPEGAVAGATWNKELSALELLFDWAAHPTRGYLPANPLGQLPGRGKARDGNSRVPLRKRESERLGIRWKAKNARSYRARWVSPATYSVWRDVAFRGGGLQAQGRGKITLGATDKKNRSRNRQRNAAFADLLYLTGLRLQEGASLLTCELPNQMSGTVTEFMLGKLTAKGDKERMILEPPEAALQVFKYLRGERRDAIERARKRDKYSGSGWLLVDQVSVRGGITHVRWASNQQWVVTGSIPPEVRQKMLLVDENGEVEPLILWLDERGMPMTDSSWEKVFERGNERFQQQAEAIGHHAHDRVTVTPHALRFSYALMLLVAMHKQIDLAYGDTGGPEYDWIRYDPAYRTVQEQLGHASLSTTREIYLEAVKDQRNANLLRGASGDVSAAFLALSQRVESVWSAADLPDGGTDDDDEA
jgi:site-specific recombinase XerD